MAVTSALHSLFQNVIFLSAITSLCIAQVIKMVIYLLTNRIKKPLEAIETVIWRTGGMPSSHSAIVCSLATSTGMTEGISSNMFIFSIVFAMIVLRDSVGVRRSTGLQAKALNTLGKQTAEKTGLKFHSVKEIQGHAPLEVLAGAVLGIIIAICFFLILT